MPKVGFKHSDETRNKMREAKLKNPSRYWLGKKRPDISEMNKGKVFSAEHREKLRQAKLKNPVRYWKGKSREGLHSEKWKKEMSERMSGKNNPFYGKDMSGSNNPRW